MKKFKNKNTGEVVRYTTQGYYRTEEGVAVPSRFIEDSCDWEEVIKKFEILSFKSISVPDYILFLGEEGYVSAKGDYEVPLEDMLANNNFVIHSVKRLPDSEIFTIGDKVKDGKYGVSDTIKRLSISNCGETIYVATTNMSWGQYIEHILKIKEPLYTTYDGVDRYEYGQEYWVIYNKYSYPLRVCELHFEGCFKERPEVYKIFSTEKAALEYERSIKPKCLFKTEDGVEVFCEDSYWCVNIDLWSIWKQTAKEKTMLNNNVRAFSAEELARDYLVMNKPILSLNELLSAWDSERDDKLYRTSRLFRAFKKIAKDKLNEKS